MSGNVRMVANVEVSWSSHISEPEKPEKSREVNRRGHTYQTTVSNYQAALRQSSNMSHIVVIIIYCIIICYTLTTVGLGLLFLTIRIFALTQFKGRFLVLDRLVK